MVKRTSRVVFFGVVTLVLTSFIFLGWVGADALTREYSTDEAIPKEMYGVNSLGIATEPSEENLDDQIQKDEMNLEDIFGSEQVFPWEPGLGNHAGAIRGIY